MKNKTICNLTNDEIQFVANQELGRHLSVNEINSVINLIAEKIYWCEVEVETVME